MILCEDKMVVKGEREGSVAGIPPRRKSGGGRKWRRGNKNHSYIKMSDRA